MHIPPRVSTHRVGYATLPVPLTGMTRAESPGGAADAQYTERHAIGRGLGRPPVPVSPCVLLVTATTTLATPMDYPCLSTTDPIYY